MKILYVVHRYNIEAKTKDDEFKEFALYVTFDDEKVYKAQFNELIVLKKDVCAITDDVNKVAELQKDISEFYRIYCKH